MNDYDAVYKQTLEACIADTVSFTNLFFRAKEHPKAALIFNGLIAQASMFVIENHRCLTTLIPKTKSLFSPNYSELLRNSRHRAKLLDNSGKSIDEMTIELISIAKRQREIFLEPHRGFLGPIKRILQPDIGISIYDNHIFSTTHTIVFAFGKERDFSESAYAFGNEIGSYIGTVLCLFQLGIPSSTPKMPGLSGKIEMRDTKYETLYNRGVLDTCHMEISAGLILILANLNFLIYILSGLLPKNDLLLFRMKFITAYHANLSLGLLQQKLYKSNISLNKLLWFKDALGNYESRWLRKQKSLRNMIVHYLPDEKLISILRSNTSRIDIIEQYTGGLSFSEINNLLDRNILFLASLLEDYFKLRGDPFWIGRVE